MSYPHLTLFFLYYKIYLLDSNGGTNANNHTRNATAHIRWNTNTDTNTNANANSNTKLVIIMPEGLLNKTNEFLK